MSLRESLARSPRIAAVPGVPGAYVREISVAVWESVVEPSIARGGTAAGIALVIASACEADGVRLFADGDEESVREIPIRVVNAIASAANALNAGESDAGPN